MPQHDRAWDDQPELGYGYIAEESPYTPRRAARHSRHSAEEDEPVAAPWEHTAPTAGDWHPESGLAADDTSSGRDLEPYVGPDTYSDPESDSGPVSDSGPIEGHRAGKGGAGRNVPAAVAVGLLLAGTVVGSLLLWRPAFVLIAALAVGVGTWEMTEAVNRGGARPPRAPLLLGGVSMIALAWYGGARVVPIGLMATAFAVLVWRLGDGARGYQRDVTSAMLIATYVPFLASFAVLLARPEDGHLRVLAALSGVVLSDTAGYVTGVLFGRRPMAPSVSPKKSWEGFCGSVVFTAIGEALILYALCDVALWQGALFGLAVSVASVLGDLAESLLKRDLGVKDMSNLLPGHGGLMDRLDSILFAAPVAYAVLVFIIPAAS